MLNIDQRLPTKAISAATSKIKIVIRKAKHRLFLTGIWAMSLLESAHNLKLAIDEGLAAKVTAVDWKWVEAVGLCNRVDDHSARTMLYHGLCAIIVCIRTMIDYFACNGLALAFLVIAVIETYRRLRRTKRAFRFWSRRMRLNKGEL